MNRRFGAFLCAGAMAVTMLTGCGGGGSDTAGEEDNQFVVGMECNYAPFNWLSSNQTDS